MIATSSALAPVRNKNNNFSFHTSVVCKVGLEQERGMHAKDSVCNTHFNHKRVTCTSDVNRTEHVQVSFNADLNTYICESNVT